MISRSHKNRRAHNWLAYDASDRFLEKHAPLCKGVLYDLGAGESPYRDFFLAHADRYVSVDWSASSHETNADVMADLNGPLPIGSDVADTVVALSVLEHLREPQAMLGEAFRILKRGGSLLVQVPWQWGIHEAPHDYFRYTPHGLDHLLQKAGFVDIHIEPLAGFFSMMTLKANYFTSRFVRGPLLVRSALRRALGVFWSIGQRSAPWLDRLDGEWRREATGYGATARKP